MSELTERLRNRYCSECASIKGAGTQHDCTIAADKIDELEATISIQRIYNELREDGSA